MKGAAPYSLRVAATSPAPGRTLADYLAIGVGPVLIMLLVGSLIFFLVEIGYRGSFTGQIRWTLFWFTVAAVLVSRISIEQGGHYGAIYGVALGAATGLRLCQFLGAPLSALLLLGLVWWCASKLTWDCTVIDEDEDASGEGLLRTAGLEEREAGEAAEAEGPEPSDTTARGGGAAFETEGRRRPHAPGLWVLYFSLGVLPVFGVGQWTLPVADAEVRFRAFALCVTYMLAALGLLLVSSFLGLRRYLRQRRLSMPASMARSWIVVGALTVGGVLLVALLLPRPRGLDSLAWLAFGYRERPQQASRYAWMRGEAAEGEGRRIGTARSAEGRSGGDESGAVDRRGRGTGEGETAGEGGRSGAERSGAGEGRDRADGGGEDGGTGTETGGEPSGGGESGESAGDGGDGVRSGAPPSASVPEIPAQAWAGLRWLSVLTAVVVVAGLLFRYGRPWLEALRAALRRARQRTGGRPGKRVPAAGRVPAFAEFANPFATGQAARMRAEDLVRYTFDALQAWAADAGCARPPEQTPFEFGAALERRVPGVGEEMQAMVRLYVRTAYGGGVPAEGAVEVMQRAWAGMGR